MLATLLVLNYAKHRYKVFAVGKENRGLKRFIFKHNLTCEYTEVHLLSSQSFKTSDSPGDRSPTYAGPPVVTASSETGSAFYTTLILCIHRLYVT